MNELTPAPEGIDDFEIGALVGERRTLSKLAGGCSAADAQVLRKIRESKQYRLRAKTWEEFCPKYLGIERSTADRLIRQLEELGPESFVAMQQLGLTPKQDKLLAPRIRGNELCHAGESIRLLPENAPQIHAALREIRRPAPPRRAPRRATASTRWPNRVRRWWRSFARCARREHATSAGNRFPRRSIRCIWPWRRWPSTTGFNYRKSGLPAAESAAVCSSQRACSGSRRNQ